MFEQQGLGDNRSSAAGEQEPSDGRDEMDCRFVELIHGERIVLAISFVSDDSAFAGTMTMTWAFAPGDDGTRVTVTAVDVPSGISPPDHEKGMTSSVENLATYVGGNMSHDRNS